jgi:RNA polymerase sigma-70 factor, ECF subfamily
MPDGNDVTSILDGLDRGGGDNLDPLLPVVYTELQRMAHRQLRAERNDHTMATTDLVHEAYLKLIGLERIEWKNRAQFFAIAAQAMRRVLVDYALSRRAQKRGGGRRKVLLEDVVLVADQPSEELLELHDALTALESLDQRLGRIVECRYFAGMSIDETAEALEISPATVKRDWMLARAWLHRELSE